MQLSQFLGILVFAITVRAAPSSDISASDENPLGQPYANAVLPISPISPPLFSLFKRQGCPNLTLRCPSGGCCSYDTSCCGNSCCEFGYLCTGGTVAAPCCVAINSPTNTCGASNVSNLLCGDVRCLTDIALLTTGRSALPGRQYLLPTKQQLLL
jgi:hypothetical protein